MKPTMAPPRFTRECAVLGCVVLGVAVALALRCNSSGSKTAPLTQDRESIDVGDSASIDVRDSASAWVGKNTCGPLK